MTVGTIIYYGLRSFLLCFALIITEIIVLKVLYIFKFSTIAAVNEYFLSTIIILFDFVVVGIHFIIRITMNEHQTSDLKILVPLRSNIPLNQQIVRTEAQDTVVR